MRPKSDMRDYQHRVANYFYENPEALGVLKMGAGKTCSALTATTDLIGDGVISHGLVIAPKRVANMVWPDEIRGWEHLKKLKYSVLSGTAAQREARLMASLNHGGELTIVGIDNIQWLVDLVEDWPKEDRFFDLLIIDETSKLKNPTSKRAKALLKISSRFRNRWGLTGTPRPNSLLDVFVPAKVLTNGRLFGNSFYKFQKNNFYPTDYLGHSWAVKPDCEAKIMADMASITVALAEHEMPELPELNVLTDPVELPAAARAHYDRMERKLFAQLPDADILAVSKAVATGKLAQMANGYAYDEDGAEGSHALHDEKEQWLAELLDELQGEPVIVVYEFKEDLAMIRRLCGKNVPYLGAGVSDAQARQNIDDWNAGKLPVFALHPASGGHGLNLQHGGSRMAWISPCWSAELWDQTLARLHRPGQAAHVMVHVCVANNTVDEMKISRVVGKLSEQTAFERYMSRVRGKKAA
jgi:SNF2 family DNA or RNA helicase